jgi:Zn-dependent oligopeptidase
LVGRLVTWAIALCLVFASATALAQSKKSAKQAASLETTGEASKAAVADVLTSCGNLLAGYNSIIDGTANDSQKAYKKLVGDLKTTEKKLDGARKQVASLNKEADKFFKAWEQDLQSISNESLRDKSAVRMEGAKKRYAELGEILTSASNELAPVMQDLNDQILYLGRDLSPEAIADLSDEAAELNAQAEAATAKVKEMLETAGKTQAAADAELEGPGEAAEDTPEND